MKIWGKSLLVEGTGSTKGLNIKSWCGYHQEDSQSGCNIRAGEWATEARGVVRRQSTQRFVSHGEQHIFPLMPIQDSHTSQAESEQ